jgi:serine/threonine protein kinase
MEGLPGETLDGTTSSELPEFYDDIPMSQFLATPREFFFSNRELHIDLTVREPIPLKLGSLVGGTGKADVMTVDCRNLGYRRNLVCKIMKTQKKTKYTMEPPDLRRLRHVHVVAFVATFTHNHRDYALMYPHAKTDLGKYMEPVSNWLRGDDFCDSHVPIVSKVEELDLCKLAPSRISHLCNFFPCLAEALDYLHMENVKHKDIKPANILIDRFNSPILTDFDISHRYTDQNEAPTAGPTTFTYSYAAPEVIGNGGRPFESDVFSLGCVFSEMITLITGENLLDFESHRAGGPQSDAAFHQSIDRAQEWLNRLCDPSFTTSLRNRNRNTIQIVPSEGYHQNQALDTAIKTICSMLDPDAKKRPVGRGLSLRFCPIATEICTECQEQRLRYQSSYPTIPIKDNVGEETQHPGAAIPPGNIRGATHLAVPPQFTRYGERARSSDSPLANSNSTRFAHKAQQEQSQVSIEQPVGSTGNPSASLARPSTSHAPSTRMPVPSSLPPGKSPVPSPESNQASNDLSTNPGILSQRQKLRKAIVYDVQKRQWNMCLPSEFESKDYLTFLLLKSALTISYRT